MSDVRSDDHARHAPESPGVTSRCANCGTPVALAFCPACGQPRSADPPTVAEFVAKAVRHFLSLESKGWRTVRALLLRPGALTAEYLAGRRVPYVEPLRLFLWISVLVIAAATAFDLHLGLRIPGDTGLLLFDPDPARTGPAAGSRRFTPMRLVLEHTELGRRAAAGNAERDGLERQVQARRHRHAQVFLLLLLPVYALNQKLCWADRRRTYGEHLVFCMHTWSFLLIVLLAQAKAPPLAAGALTAWAVAWLYLAARRVYGGSWTDVLVRATLCGALNIAALLAGGLVLVYALVARG